MPNDCQDVTYYPKTHPISVQTDVWWSSEGIRPEQII